MVMSPSCRCGSGCSGCSPPSAAGSSGSRRSSRRRELDDRRQWRQPAWPRDGGRRGPPPPVPVVPPEAPLLRPRSWGAGGAARPDDQTGAMMRQRVFFRKVLGSGDLEAGPAAAELDPVIAELFDTPPAAGEDELLDAFARAHGDETVLAAAAMVARAVDALRDAYGGKLPNAVRDALTEIAGLDEPEPAPAAKTGERARDATASELLAKLAENRRRRDPSLTREQAFAKAVEAHPDLYAGTRRHALRRAGALHDSTGDLRGQRETERRLHEAADRVLAREPQLSREQAVARALAENPDLYLR